MFAWALAVIAGGDAVRAARLRHDGGTLRGDPPRAGRWGAPSAILTSAGVIAAT
jgi:hypothetical protein